MKIRDYVDYVKDKKKITSDKEVGRLLGATSAQISSWRRTGKEITPLIALNMLDKVHSGVRSTTMQEVQRTALRPIVEFYPVDWVTSRSGKKSELFAADSVYRKGLREALETANGIYLFYDSRGRGLYAGKAKSQPLWAEMKSAFNRERGEVQSVYRVEHPIRNQKFKSADEQTRRIKREKSQLWELAAYFSAYEVSKAMIDNMEALIVRAFANDLLNSRMENFGSSS